MNSILLNRLRRLDIHELYTAVYQDPLTGILNRRAFNEAGQGFPAIALVDLDSLKFINDHHGHRAGDRCIQELAWVLRGRFEDRVYRLGGDEFAITSTNAAKLSEEVLQLRHAFPVFSFGVGATLEEADGNLKREKRLRTLNGERAARCETPPWLDRVAV